MLMTINIEARRELFVDTHLIDRMIGTRLKLHTPVSGGVAVTFDEPWANVSAGYGTVIKDGGTYRLYYRKTFEAPSGDDSEHQVTCYAESPDGITWTKPNLGLYEIKGSRENNIAYAGLGPTSHNFSFYVVGHSAGGPHASLVRMPCQTALSLVRQLAASRR
jgi:hypothetical protein